MTNGNDKNNQKDLTSIEDLGDFLHIEDSEVDDKFGGFELPSELPESETEIEAEEVAEPDEVFGQPEVQEEINFSNGPSDDSDFQNTEDEEVQVDFNDLPDSSAADDSPFELSSVENNDFSFSGPLTGYQSDSALPEETLLEKAHTPEKFEEVKNFAQHFSYGQIQGGGNPPFSLILRNIKYSEDAQDILIILREFGLVTDHNTSDTQKSLELGSLLVPQINEYSAIVLAHKFRRFDCDIEVGLSDEVHPSKSGETNPRGLTKRDGLRQNIVETYHKGEDDILIKDVIVSTTSSLEDHLIKKYVGVHSSFAIVDEEELERLKFVQHSIRSNSSLENYETGDTTNFTSERAFSDYQKSFEFLFIDLCEQLKVRAMKEKANALLGLNYQLVPLPFEKTNMGKNCYQIICTATLAIVIRK